MLAAEGTLYNRDAAPHSYRLNVDFVNGSGQPVAGATAELDGVAAGDTRPWNVQTGYGGDLAAEGGSCRVSSVVVIG